VAFSREISLQEEISVAVFNRIKSLNVFRISLLAIGLLCAGSLTAQSLSDQIAERLKPVGEVCLAGDACSGGGASAPAAQTAAAGAEFSAEQTYQQSCAVCHNSGVAGAPKYGDSAEWTARMTAKGMETVVQNAINGINAMPARGMCMTCSDENIAALVEYISGPTQ